MPVAEKGSGQGRQAFLIMFAGLAGFLAIAFLIQRQGNLVQDSGAEYFGAGAVFVAGPTEDLLASINDTGPILFSDVASRDRDVILQHLGDDEDSGWIAMAARPLSAARDCTLEWQATEREFLEPCSGDRFPEDGGDLVTYPVSISDTGVLSIDINAADRETTTTVEETDDGE